MELYIDYLADLGVEHAILCTGSRSAPLTLAFFRNKRIQSKVMYDERSAAYIALGLAQATQKPVVVVCTSGSALANIAPAVTEAYWQHVPLLIFSADRPEEWIGQAEGQTIYQQNFFGKHVKYFANFPDNTSQYADKQWLMYHILQEAYLNATNETPGPVHINFPFREPFYPSETVPDQTAKKLLPYFLKSYQTLQPEHWELVLKVLTTHQKILLVVGARVIAANQLDIIADFVQQYKIPTLVDAASNTMVSGHSITLTEYIIEQNDTQLLENLMPDVILYIGQGLVSKRQLKIVQKLASNSKHVIRIQPAGEWQDIFRANTILVPLKPEIFFRELRNKIVLKIHTEFARYWQGVQKKGEAVVENIFENTLKEETINEWSTVQYFFRNVKQPVLLHLANSLPIRLATYALHLAPHIQIFHNRGTSGIDGSLSTAVGNALANPRYIVFLIVGDVSLWYDQNALLNTSIPENLRILVLNNHGGGIFKMVDDAARQPDVDDVFVGVQPKNFNFFCKHHELSYACIKTTKELFDLMPSFAKGLGVQCLEIETKSSCTKATLQTIQESFRNPKTQWLLQT